MVRELENHTVHILNGSTGLSRPCQQLTTTTCHVLLYHTQTVNTRHQLHQTKKQQQNTNKENIVKQQPQ